MSFINRLIQLAKDETLVRIETSSQAQIDGVIDMVDEDYLETREGVIVPLDAIDAIDTAPVLKQVGEDHCDPEDHFDPNDLTCQLCPAYRDCAGNPPDACQRRTPRGK